MLFLDDFLEMLEELPLELRDRCKELEKLDMYVQNGMDRHRKGITEFLSRASTLSVEDRQRGYDKLRIEFLRLRGKAEEKIKIAEKMQELVEKYVAHLEKEKTHFKMELEGDNPGITGQIEKRFSDYVESVIALRKEQRKRKHNHSNGFPTIAPLKIARSDSISSLRTLAFNGDFPMMEDDILASFGTPRSRKGSLMGDETPPTRKKPPRNSLSTPNIICQAVSPAASEKSWTPSFGSATPHDQSPAPSFVANGPPSANSTIAMPNFSGPESRHGRPRKLTSRVQEMFKETLQRQRSHHPPSIEESTVVDGGGGAEDGSETSEEEDDEAKRTWCICKEKSYGNMVACDNEKCPFEWFHYHCVGITAPPRGKWFCAHCSEQMNAPSHGLDINF